MKIHSTSEVGSIVYGKIYQWDPTNATTFADALFYVQQTEYHEITQQDLNQGVISLPLLAPTTLTAANNTYFAVAATDGDGGTTDDVQIATSGTSPAGFSYFYAADDDAWYLQPATPIVRLNFDGSTWGLNEATNVSALNIFPNPANDEVNVSFNINDASDVKVEVLDMTGKVVSEKAYGMTAPGTKLPIVTSLMDSGVYIGELNSDGNLMTKQLSVE